MILQELNRAFDARAKDEKWPVPGFATRPIRGVVELSRDGSVREMRPFLEEGKVKDRKMPVPSEHRTSGLKAMFLWDKTSYSLGVVKTAGGFGQEDRTLAEHETFKKRQLSMLADARDPSLVAMARFCKTWKPEMFEDFPDAVDLLGGNLAFRVDGSNDYVHDIDEAREILERTGSEDAAGAHHSMCLVDGSRGPVADVHPGFNLGTKDTLSLVSFNNDAETFMDRKQGRNAPVSRKAASKYGIALAAFLAKDSGNSTVIGDDRVVFWAEDRAADVVLDNFFVGKRDEERKLRDVVSAIAEGRRPEGIDPDGKVFVLVVAQANKGRMMVRQWHAGTARDFTKNVMAFWDDMAIQPSPFTWKGAETTPKAWMLAYDAATNRKTKNKKKKEKLPPRLGSDLMRAVIGGGRYPAAMLTGTIARIRAEGEQFHDIDGRRAAIIAPVLKRNHGKEVPMALDENETRPAYQLGRLFGVYVYAENANQKRAAGLRQKYFAAASASPATVFPRIMRGYEHNLAKIEKNGEGGKARWIDGFAREIIGQLDSRLPATLSLEDQGLFFIGFYHQDRDFYKPRKNDDAIHSDKEITNE